MQLFCLVCPRIEVVPSFKLNLMRKMVAQTKDGMMLGNAGVKIKRVCRVLIGCFPRPGTSAPFSGEGVRYRMQSFQFTIDHECASLLRQDCEQVSE
jgi:hypothetical protein